MRPCVSVGWGSKLHLLTGSKAFPANLTFVSDPTANDPISSWQPDFSPGTAADYEEALYGGIASIWPASYCNHKAGAFYYGEFYWSQHDIKNDGALFLMKWDGSGIHKHGGFTSQNGYAANWRNGRGTELISPSGTNLQIGSNALSCLVHNGILFYVGSVHRINESPNNSTWTTKLDWDMDDDLDGAGGDDGGSFLRMRRAYKSFVVQKDNKTGKEKRLFGKRKKFNVGTSGLAPSREETHACDAISWKDDIIFCNQVDIVRFPGGSGTPEIVESTLDVPSSKSLNLYPASGFNSNNQPIGNSNLLMLTGSGVLKKINFPSGIGFVPSGTTTLIDLGNFVKDPDTEEKLVRTDSIMARRDSSTAEPQRSCYLKTFNEQLHAFFVSSTSGYFHLKCDGDPSNSNNWDNITKNMSEDFRRFDGDIYGYHDTFRNSLYVMHVPKGEIAMWGCVGTQKGAGGFVINELNTNLNWREIYRGGAGEPSIGLVPYDNLGIYATAPSGGNPEIIASTDYALINYKLHSPFTINVNVEIEFSINNGLTWDSARRFRNYDDLQFPGDGKENLEASFFGTNHTFYWDHVTDLGLNSQEKNILIRIRPKVVR